MNNYEVLNTFANLLIKYSIDGKYYVLLGPVNGYDNINSSIYLFINDKLVDKNSQVLNYFITKYFNTGFSLELLQDKNYVLGTDWFLSETLFNSLNENTELTEFLSGNETYKMHDYVLNNKINKEFYYDITDINIKDILNLEYINKLNKISENTFSEDVLNNFYSVFCQIILHYSNNEKLSDLNNTIYKSVLNYFKNYKIDDASKQINIILGSNIYGNKGIINNSCNCVSDYNMQNNSNINTESCSTLYDKSMHTYLENMLGDYKFYNDWFLYNNDETEVSSVNMDLINNIKTLIIEFIKLDKNLAFNSHNSHSNCGCNLGSDENKCNYETLNNYLELLTYIENNSIIENKNKIKIYGEAFGKLLPNLIF